MLHTPLTFLKYLLVKFCYLTDWLRRVLCLFSLDDSDHADVRNGKVKKKKKA